MSQNSFLALWTKRYPWIESFTNSPQYKNTNIANFVLAIPFKLNQTNEVCNLEKQYSYTYWHLISPLLKIIKETTNIWEYKVCINATIANVVRLWKCPMTVSLQWLRLNMTSCLVGSISITQILKLVYSPSIKQCRINRRKTMAEWGRACCRVSYVA